MVQLVAHRLMLALALLAMLGLASCAPQPDADVVRQALQRQLDAAFGARVLQIESFKRAGSQALPGRDGRLVYYDAELTLMSDYHFGEWDRHNVATLANLLGAGPKGVFGLGISTFLAASEQRPNRPEDIPYAFDIHCVHLARRASSR